MAAHVIRLRQALRNRAALSSTAVGGTDEALQGASKALREAIYAHDHWMEHVDEKDLPVPVIDVMQRAIDALSQALTETERARR